MRMINVKLYNKRQPTRVVFFVSENFLTVFLYGDTIKIPKINYLTEDFQMKRTVFASFAAMLILSTAVTAQAAHTHEYTRQDSKVYVCECGKEK